MEAITIVATIIGIAAGVVTLIKEWPVIVKAASTLREKAANSKLPDFKRRKLMVALSLGVAGSIIYASFPLLKETVKKLSTVRRPSENDKFVKNETSGIIHHAEVCANHLPNNLLAVEPRELISSESIHESKLNHIASLEDLEIEREAIIINAIKKSPTSTHLYKYLVSEWGRKKEYSRIHTFLETNLEHLKSLLSQYAYDKRLNKKYEKAIAELEQRRDKARYLAKMANFS
ncbi:hypothetical protein [Pseudomaricurvus sp. HS19]|uniref:hypothetical protein n=1 Tax=Pseudomaricurvus sp. HS19 TaxID=2692626 RepID=UPI00136BB327|nr:hypothetical protein [Pseudomaricurvus sp. HS19]MYM64194.1 hypothetical protein [Pseudomaricurvus sp. HS19]